MIAKDFYEGKSDIFETNQINNSKTDLVYVVDYEEESLKVIKEWEKSL